MCWYCNILIMFIIDNTSLGTCLICASPENVVQWLGGEVWSPQVLWSNAEQDYVHLRVSLDAISSGEK